MENAENESEDAYQLPRCIVRTHWRCLQGHDRWPFFGAKWNGILRSFLRPYFAEDWVVVPHSSRAEKPSLALEKIGLLIHPWETGHRGFQEGETTVVGLSFPRHRAAPIAHAFGEWPTRGPQPDETFRSHWYFQGATCALCEQPWTEDHLCGIGVADLEADVEVLAKESTLTVTFHFPLLMKLPAELAKAYPGRSRWDPWTLMDERNWPTLAAHLWGKEHREAWDRCQVTSATFVWLETKYSDTHGKGGKDQWKNNSGAVGTLVLAGRFTAGMLQTLVRGQLVGIGNARGFGNGQYVIHQSPLGTRVHRRSTQLWDPLWNLDKLRELIGRIPTSRRSWRGEARPTLLRAQAAHWAKYRRDLVEGRSIPGDIKNDVWEDGAKRRVITLSSPQDQLNLSLCAEVIQTALDPGEDSFFSEHSFGFRRNRSYHQAVRCAEGTWSGKAQGNQVVQADVEDFFPSVSRTQVLDLIDALFWSDPVSTLLRTYFQVFDRLKLRGLPLGLPISPVLSNLILSSFDRDLTLRASQAGAKLIAYVRYADDLLLIVGDRFGTEAAVELIAQSLQPWKLRLHPQKTTTALPSVSFRYLGYTFDGNGRATRCETVPELAGWEKLQTKTFLEGQPLYLSRLGHQFLTVKSDHLLLEKEDGVKQRCEWSQVSGLHLYGEVVFPARLIHESIKRGINHWYHDYKGNLTGILQSSKRRPPLRGHQILFNEDPDKCLSAAKALISAKIANGFRTLARWGGPQAATERWQALVQKATNLDRLRGVEGAAARWYFSAFSGLVAPFEFPGRHYHPALDPINALLSFGYTQLLIRFTDSLLSRGVDTDLGFFHRRHGAHETLASDLMEPYRPLVDHFVITMVRQPSGFREDDFERSPEGYRLLPAAQRRFLQAWDHFLDHPQEWSGTSDSAPLREAVEDLSEEYIASIRLNQVLVPWMLRLCLAD